MKKKPRKTKLPRWVEKVVRIHVPASLPPEFFEIAADAMAQEQTAEAKEAVFRGLAEKFHMDMDRFVEEKFVALLEGYGIPEDAPGAGWHSAAAGWRLAFALALDRFPWIDRTDDAPPKPVGRQRKTADEKLVMAVDAARAKRGATYPQAFAAVARLPEYKKRSLREGGSGWVKPAYYRAKRKMRRLSLANLYQEGQ
jgi:hypothetical protein